MITLEWRNRVDCWRKVLPKLFFVPLGEVLFEGFTTFEQLTPSQALANPLRPFPPGTRWGAHNETAWLRAAVRIPETARGERIVVRPETGLESLVWIDGKAVGSRSWSERDITLTLQAQGGETIDILLQTYAGNGTRECGTGPVPDGVLTVPPTPECQATIEKSEFGIWNEEVYQLWLDVETLAKLAEAMADRESLRLAQIEDALAKMTVVVDPELPRAEMLETVRQGRELLKPLLQARNGTTAPGMHCFGHAHLDLAWLWPLAETDRKCGRTFSSQLTLMEEYPEYKFLQSQPYLYEVAQRQFPDIYERVHEAVKRGQWVPDGAMWVEADTNLPSGESLIRQFLYGKQFFQEEFGIDSRLMWLPDVFGYSGALPQIMQGCRVDYFSTQKIFWIYDGGEIFPYNWFWWEGIDGSRILTYLHFDYNSQTDPKTLATRWSERPQKTGFHTKRLLPFGWGDGGGGPVRDHVEYLRRQSDLEGSPRCTIEAPTAFFEEMVADKKALAQVPTWVGELYFQAHRGTFTSQAHVKKSNRRCEHALHDLEFWGGAAALLRGKAFPAEHVEALWKEVLLNQFHDIIPGSSIHQVYVEAGAAYARVLEGAAHETASTLSALCDTDADALTLFNSQSWERQEIVELPEGFDAATDLSGNALLTQQVCGKTFAQTPPVPATGWTTVRRGAKQPAAATSPLTATPTSLENEFLRVTLNDRGELTSIWDKETQSEWAAGACNSLRMYKDVPNSFDAWDITSTYKQTPVLLDSTSEIEVITAGPLLAIVRVKRQIHTSQLVQDIVLAAGSRRIEFRTQVDWHEKHKLLKVNFPVTVRSDTALNEIQFGHVPHPTHASRPSDATQFEVCQHRWTALAESARGAAVLNDCKYGVDVEGNSINLTLLRAPLGPDMTADQGSHEFTYAFYAWGGRGFAESGLVQQGYELNAPLMSAPGAAEPGSLFSLSAPNIILETLKPAEDGSGDLIVRFYESARTATRAKLEVKLPFKHATLTNLIEENQTPLPFDGKSLALEFRPFEIKTVRFSK
ncbi:MAG: alpha-mannosidase [Chthoniobacteraceae bacterium]